MKEIWNRIDGKVPDKVETNLPPNWKLNLNITKPEQDKKDG
jgi:hypothetical protein